MADEGLRDKEIKEPPMLFDRTQELLSEVEDAMGCKTFTYWTSDRGMVCDNDVVALYELFKKIGPAEEIAVFIKSPGGSVEAALRIVNLLREYYTTVTALVPLQCASAATMIALGANEIRMGPLAHLTAIDSSLTHDLSPLDDRENRRVSVSQDELARIVNLWDKSSREHHGNPYTDIFKYIHPLVVGALDRASSLSIQICKEILSYHITDEAEAERISTHLNSNYPSHTYPITLQEADRIGLNIKELDASMNDRLVDLNELYSEMAQKALTDFDEFAYHDNEILNIVEAKGSQIYYQNDQDWNYIKEERRWHTLNDESSWRRIDLGEDGEKIHGMFHIR